MADRSTAAVTQRGIRDHETGAHPENAGRLEAVLERLGDYREGFSWLEARAAAVEDIERSHAPEHVESIRAAAERGGGNIDADTVVSSGSYETALRSAGAALVAVDSVLGGGVDSAFCLNRPPGHHATADRAMGFCLFNNVSVAARYAQARHGLGRVAIVDWDVHHGNGTHDIHYSDGSVQFISLHQWPLYPGTGRRDERGSGEGEGSTLNIPMDPGSGDREYLGAFETEVLPALAEFGPELLLVSAGQDCHFADPLANQKVTARGFYGMASHLAEFAQGDGGPAGIVAVHEGGYNPETLPLCDHAILAGFAGIEIDLSEPGVPLA